MSTQASNGRIILFAVAGIFIALTISACHDAAGPTASDKKSVPTTDAEKQTQGAAMLTQMSDKLRGAEALSFSTVESIERVRRNNEKATINIERQIKVRRPDKMWFKATGDRDLECNYNGKVVTLISHKDKVFGEFPAAPTLDETEDLISSKYDIALPIADLLTNDPREALTDEKTVGGWVKRETIEGVECNTLAYQHPNVDFTVWIPVSGDPLPKKLQITYKARRGQPTSTIVFKDWNLSPQFSKETFARNGKVPDDYEGIPVIQRASAVLENMQLQPAEPAATKEPAAKPKSK
jgi:hypothetical protein